MATNDEHLARLLAAESFSTAVEDLISSEGVDTMLTLARSWGSSDSVEARGTALGLLSEVASPEVPGAAELILEQARRVTGSDDEWLRWQAAGAIWSVAHTLVAMCPNDADAARRSALSELLRFADDEDDDVRYEVALGLPGLLGTDPAPTDPGVVALVRLFRDRTPVARSWAVFAFTGALTVDSQEIRDELLKVATDNAGGDAAAEAAEALAQRGDARVLPVVLRELSRDDVTDLWVGAAARMPDPVLLPALERLKAIGWAERDIDPENMTHGYPTGPHWLDVALAAARAQNDGPRG